jgi:hypothetical protein
MVVVKRLVLADPAVPYYILLSEPKSVEPRTYNVIPSGIVVVTFVSKAPKIVTETT